jgi:ATP-dependent DNA helicase RecG
VIDEEHRFGVEQRRKLLQGHAGRAGDERHPDPRSLALTYYGDLELSIIDELPPGRKPITTKLVNDSKRRDVYRFAWGEIKKGGRSTWSRRSSRSPRRWTASCRPRRCSRT